MVKIFQFVELNNIYSLIGARCIGLAPFRWPFLKMSVIQTNIYLGQRLINNPENHECVFELRIVLYIRVKSFHIEITMLIRSILMID